MLGIDKDTAKAISSTRKGYWTISETYQLHTAISNERLQQKGLMFPLDHYLKVHTEI